MKLKGLISKVLKNNDLEMLLFGGQMVSCEFSFQTRAARAEERRAAGMDVRFYLCV